MIGVAHSADASILLTQSPSTNGAGYASQRFPDSPEDIYAFDDFTVGAGGWHVTKITVNGIDRGIPADNLGVSLAFTSTPTVAALYAASPYHGVEDANHNLVFTSPINLAAGHYYFSAFVTRAFNPGGQWYWQEGTTHNGDAFTHTLHWKNNSLPDVQMAPGNADLAFTIEGSNGINTTVPEPSSFVAFAFGALCLGVLAMRRRSAV